MRFRSTSSIALLSISLATLVHAFPYSSETIRNHALVRRVTGEDLWDQLQARLQDHGHDTPIPVIGDDAHTRLDRRPLDVKEMHLASTGQLGLLAPDFAGDYEEYKVRYYNDTDIKKWVDDHDGAYYSLTLPDGTEEEFDDGEMQITMGATDLYATWTFKRNLPYRWSTYAWDAWVKHCLQYGLAANALQAIYRQGISNGDTIKLIEQLLPRAGQHNMTSIDPLNVAHQVSFFHLIKKPNVVGIVYLLIEHASELRKTIGSIDIARVPAPRSNWIYSMRINLLVVPRSRSARSSSKYSSLSKESEKGEEEEEEGEQMEWKDWR